MDQLLQAKLMLESEQKYLSQLITLGSIKNREIREKINHYEELIPKLYNLR